MVTALVLWLSTVTPAWGQTFVQLTDLGQGIGARLTRSVASQRLGVALFGEIGAKVSFIDHNIVYQFASDPAWGRILSGRMDFWVHEYDNRAGPGGRLRQPLSIDISARKYVYVADRARGFILLAEFSPAAQNLVNAGTWSSPLFPKPVDVAWDGRTTPLTVDYLYVLDDSLSRVSYWDRPTLLWSYGTVGSGAGQFLRPSGICAGKTVASTGGTQFTNYFYVVDRGNRRVVWLNREPAGATWMGTAALSDWDPTDCAVDHFGNLYVTDELRHRIHKFTHSLSPLTTYGAYGKGATNLNTFAFPRAISVPCGLKIVNSQTVWYCEGRLITAEDWSDATGAVEHYLNFELALTAGPDTSTPVASMAYRTTDHTRQWVRVIDGNNANVRWLASGMLGPPGTIGWLWDGRRDNGTWAPPGNYRFRIDIESAYGCGHAWCQKTIYTTTFWSNGNDCSGGGGPQAPRYVAGTRPDIARQPCLAPGETEVLPSIRFLRQRILMEPQPLRRVTGLEASAPSEVTTTATGSLTELVRLHGVRGLAFSVPADAGLEHVSIRVHALSGRLVRVLVDEPLNAGFFEIAWDGLDDRGRAAAPGLYIAVLVAGGQRLVQRLILRQNP